MFSSWAESGLTNAIMAVGQIVAPFEGDLIEPGQEGVDWETNEGVDPNTNGDRNDDLDMNSLISVPSSDEQELKTGASVSEDSFDGGQYLAERMAFDSPDAADGTGRSYFQDHSRVLDSDSNTDCDADPDTLNSHGPFSSPCEAKPKRELVGFDGISPIASGSPAPLIRDKGVPDQAVEIEQLREKGFYLERTIAHLVEDQELLERKLAEKNRVILQLQAFETMTAQLQTEVRDLREQNARQAGTISEHRALTSVFSPGGQEGESAAAAAERARETDADAQQGAKMSELIFALTEYEHRVQGLQLEVDMLRSERDQAGVLPPKEAGAATGTATEAAVEAEMRAIVAQLATAEASVQRLEAEAEARRVRTLQEADATRELEQLRRAVADTAQLQERYRLQGAELEAAIDQSVVMSQEWADLTAQMQELRARNAELARECEQVRGGKQPQDDGGVGQEWVLELQSQLESLRAEREEQRQAESGMRGRIEQLEREARAVAEQTSLLRSAAVSATDSAQELVVYKEENAVLASEAEVRKAGETALRDEVRAAKAKALSVEEEKKQLNVIIAQLRSTRRVNKDENDTILAERNQFREQCEQLTVEIDRVREQQRAESEAATGAYVAQLQASLQASQASQEDLLRSSSELQAAFDVVEKQHHDACQELEALSADHVIAQQDLRNREQELANMMSIVANVEGDSRAAAARLVREHEARVTALEAGAAEALLEKTSACEAQLEIAGVSLKELGDKLEIEQLLRRKAEVEMRREKKRMEATVETALRQLKNTNMEEVVDRTLIANLITTYVEQRRSLEVMKLLGNILHFTPEQEMVVGLRVPPPSISLQSGMSSLYSAVTSLGGAGGGSSASPPPPLDLQGDSLGELLVSFLEAESGTNSQPSSPKKAAGREERKGGEDGPKR